MGSQENFLKYMREHFNLDRLIEHGTEPLPATTVVVNPAHRRVEQQIRRQRCRLQRLAAHFGAHTLPPEATAEQVRSDLRLLRLAAPAAKPRWKKLPWGFSAESCCVPGGWVVT